MAKTKGAARTAAPKKTSVPLSENQALFRPDWTAEDCIAELQRIANIDTTKVISRNYFRNHARCSESTWNRFFGTFHEYKRQANIVLSRHQHKLEREIAKHASVDNQRKMNLEKAGWEDKYLRPDGQRWQTAIIANDVHDIECDPFWRRVFVDACRRVQPQKIKLNGDIFDLPEFSRFVQDPRAFNVIGRIKWVHEFLAELREACPNAEIILIEGNHEFRLIRHLTEATPALVTVLADLHGLTIPKLLGLEKFEVNYVARMDLTAWREVDITKELKKNYVISWGAILCHHFPEGKDMGYPGSNGHHHKHLVSTSYSPIFGPFEWHQVGAGHRRAASYCPGEKWSNGFLVAHVDTHSKSTQFEYTDVRDFAVFGGRYYFREAGERFHANHTN